MSLMKKIVILFSGTGTNFEYLAKHLPSKGIKIEAALTNNPNAKGIEVAKKYEIPLEVIDSKTFEKREDFDKKVVERLKKYDFNLVVLAGFMRILTPVFTNEFRAINLHPSLLPRHKGLNAIEKSYYDKHSKGGVTVHFVTSELDSGEIILQKSINKKDLTYQEYYEKIRVIEKEALFEAILKIV